MNAKSFSVVVAATAYGRGIGVRGGLPWKLPTDLAFFKKLTSTAAPGLTNAVIMGRTTWDLIPRKFRPLPNRINIVLSRKEELRNEISSIAGVHAVGSLDAAVALISGQLAAMVDQVFVIGGGEVYREALDSPACNCNKVYLTMVLREFEVDTVFPELRRFKVSEVGEVQTENGIPFQFTTWTRAQPGEKVIDACCPAPVADEKSAPVPSVAPGALAGGNPEEQQYLDLIRVILDTGNTKGDRTGVGTISKFGCQMRFNLRNSFPLLTTKRVFWRGVVEELIWLIQGCTDSKVLARKDVKIWDGNGSREFLDKMGFNQREEGDLGPVYGFQWRHFGAKYVDCNTNYEGQGVDQLMEVIDRIKNNPNDRRILLSAWNASDLGQMALPPCHVLCQFYVANGELSCQMYQRSCDMGLGVPFNIASYSLLTVLIAHVCGLKPGDFVHTLGDSHVYLNHVQPLRQQIERTPRAFPTVRINESVKDITKVTFEDIFLENYNPLPTIKMEMAV